MLEPAAHVSALLLGLTFAWASVAKLARWRRWRTALERYRLDHELDRVARVGVPAAETGVVALVVTGHARIAAALAVALLSGFSLAVLRARAATGSKLPCGCFGRTHLRDYREMLLRNALLGALAAIVLVGAERPTAWVPARGDVLPALLTAAGAVVLVLLTWQVSSALRRRA